MCVAHANRHLYELAHPRKFAKEYVRGQWQFESYKHGCVVLFLLTHPFIRSFI